MNKVVIGDHPLYNFCSYYDGNINSVYMSNDYIQNNIFKYQWMQNNIFIYVLRPLGRAHCSLQWGHWLKSSTDRHAIRKSDFFLFVGSIPVGGAMKRDISSIKMLAKCGGHFYMPAKWGLIWLNCVIICRNTRFDSHSNFLPGRRRKTSYRSMHRNAHPFKIFL